MPFADPATPPTFSEVHQLLDMTTGCACRRHAQARDRLAYHRGEQRYALANLVFDAPRVVQTQGQLELAQREEKEARLLLVLLQDVTFRRELATLDLLWRRLRLSRPGATDDRFADVVMSMPEEETTELRASWKTICSLIESKALVEPTSALTL